MNGIMAENDQLRAVARVLRDANDHAYAVAKKGLIPGADLDELLAKVRDVLTRARSLVDSLNGAEHRKGFEIADAEILELEAMDAVGYYMLSGEAQIRWLCAMKRKNARPRIVRDDDYETEADYSIRTQFNV